jgi:outer membrane murein-binding lipoprotein Lpp
MRKKTIGILLAAVLALSMLAGCGLLNDINQTVDYVNDTAAYVNETTSFVAGAAALAEQAVLNEAAREQLRQKLEEMKASIAEFNKKEPPEIAEAIHKQLLSYNETLQQKLNAYSEQIRGGNWSESLWNGSGIAEAVAPITALLDKIKSLNP